MTAQDRSELRRFWPVILTCFCVAVFAWGFGFYGQAIYLAELTASRGWRTTAIAGATTAMYLCGAFCMPWIGSVIGRLSPRVVLCGGFGLLGLGAIAFSTAHAPWQLYAAAVPMAVGWSFCSGPAIAITLAYWFERRRPLALSLALNGASASGFIVAPLLVSLSQAMGLHQAVAGSVLAFWLMLVPVVLLCLRHPPISPAAPARATGAATDARPAFTNKAAALRSGHFWSVTLPFALVLLAQVGFIVHMIAFLIPTLGPGPTGLAVSLASAAAMLGRIGLGFVIDRLHQRGASALSFTAQAAGLGLMLARPTDPAALFAGSILFGASVGNVITLPAILIQREFAAAAFGLLVGLNGAIGQFALALGPVLFGLIRDVTGGYGAVLILCMTLQLGGAVLVLRRGR
jgi:MFS family permease